MTVKAMGAFSGGLDGLLASRLLIDQGIEVHLATFASPFFSCAPGREGASLLGVPWRGIDFTSEIVALVNDPPSGFGSHLNPCVDCHASMFRVLWATARSEGFNFIFSGEVLGQRPMSQNRGSLNRVKNLSETGKVLLRPLSALLLEPTEMEIQGMVDRTRLLGFSGRSRKPQIALAREMGLKRIPAPAGGCLLTDPGYSMRLKVLIERGLFTPESARAIRSGRMFDLGNAVALVGRSEHDNRALSERKIGTFLQLQDIPGPLGLLVGPREPSNLLTLAGLMALYTRGGVPVRAVTDDGGEVTAEPCSAEEAEKLVVRLP